jgi:deoxyribonuclease V
LGGLSPPSWHPEGAELSAAGCFVVFPRGRSGPGAEGDAATAAAVIVRDGRVTATRIVHGHAGAPYAAGLLYLREGHMLEEVVRQLPDRPDVLVVNGTGLDHPRHAGMALHLGYLLNLPTVGVTHRPLCADGSWPDDERGSISPLTHDGQIVGYWVRTHDGARPLVAHGAWRTSSETAAEVVLAVTTRFRTPDPLRLARQVARTARAGIDQVV